jgi:hypothetical protein
VAAMDRGPQFSLAMSRRESVQPSQHDSCVRRAGARVRTGVGSHGIASPDRGRHHGFHDESLAGGAIKDVGAPPALCSIRFATVSRSGFAISTGTSWKEALRHRPVFHLPDAMLPRRSAS